MDVGVKRMGHAWHAGPLWLQARPGLLTELGGQMALILLTGNCF